MTLEPFTLSPILVDRPWGGVRLSQFHKELGVSTTVGESWELADLPAEVAPTVDDPQTRVATGRFAGQALHELIATHRSALLGPVEPTADGRFPLLLKLLDARENLSVQVHPPASYVESHPEARLKTESWYVVKADPGSVLYLDLEGEATIEDLGARLGTDDIVQLLRRVDAVEGEFWHLPAGLVHALGAGTMVAEVQTPSDTTFRMYDWSTEYGRQPRQLHFDEALASVRIGMPETHVGAARDGDGSTVLTDNTHYRIVEHRIDGASCVVGRTPGPCVVMVVRGSVAMSGLSLAAGSTAVVPHERGAVDITPGEPSTVLEISLQS